MRRISPNTVRIITHCCALVSILLALLGPAQAQEIYKCLSADGRITYDNAQKPGCHKISLDLGGSATKQPLRPQKVIPDKRQEKPAQQDRSEITGTAFAVSDSLLITNNHVVQNCSRIRTKHLGSIVTLKARDKQLDLALLNTTVRFDRFAEFREEGPLTGEEVMIAGYPLVGILGQDMSVAKGIVSARRAHEKNPNNFLHTAPTQPGNSGGPVFDQSGLAIGVVVGKLNDLMVARVTGSLPQNINVGISGSGVIRFLKANGVEPRLGTDSGYRKGNWIANNALQFTVLIHCYKD